MSLFSGYHHPWIPGLPPDDGQGGHEASVHDNAGGQCCGPGQGAGDRGGGAEGGGLKM